LRNPAERVKEEEEKEKGELIYYFMILPADE
jgi:hypothetical protein